MRRRNLPSVAAVAALLLLWQGICMAGLIPRYMLPSPVEVLQAFVDEFPLLWENSLITLQEAFLGLLLGVSVGFLAAVLMDAFDVLYKAFYPLLILTQTIPSVAIAPLLVLWFGYEMAPKVILIVITTFFPITVGLLNGFKSIDTDSVHLLRAMGAGRWQIFSHINSSYGGILWVSFAAKGENNAGICQMFLHRGSVYQKKCASSNKPCRIPCR